MARDNNGKKSLEEYLCGAGASSVNILFTFPLNKLMFRQQMDGIRLAKAFRQLRREGARNLYRGVLPPFLQKTITVSLMFGVYSQNMQFLSAHFPGLPYIPCHCVAAAGAGFAEAILVPLERAQCLLQSREYNKKLINTKHTLNYLRHLGIMECYRGLSAVLLRNSGSNILFLGFREPLMNALPTPRSRVGELTNAFISGAGLGMFLSTAFFPLNVVKNRLMTQIQTPYHGIVETFYVIFKERNYRWTKMFRGVHINYTRAFISWGIINTTYESLKKFMDKYRHKFVLVK